jgi:hypothetical protein
MGDLPDKRLIVCSVPVVRIVGHAAGSRPGRGQATQAHAGDQHDHPRIAVAGRRRRNSGALVADEAQLAFGAVGLHLAWPVYAIIAFVLVVTLACLDIKLSATVILVLEGASMLLVITACGIILVKSGYHGHAFSSAPFRLLGTRTGP